MGLMPRQSIARNPVAKEILNQITDLKIISGPVNDFV
jgi:hypothetical protein